MTTKIVASLLFIALGVLGSGAGAAAASPPAAPAPNTGANTGNLDMTSPGGFFAPPPRPGLSTGPGVRATPPAAPAPASPYPPPYHVQSPTAPATSPVGPSPGGTPNTPGTGGGTGTALPPAP